MRIFLAGASGVIGTRLLPLLHAAGHAVAAMTRTPAKTGILRSAGAEPVVCDVFDRPALLATVAAFKPDVVMHQVTDLPDEAERIAEFRAANRRVRDEGTRNLIEAARTAGATRLVAQSVAWAIPGIETHEAAVVAAGGTVLRYGQFHGPGTYFETDPPPAPRVHIDEAARRTMDFLRGPAGVFTITDDANA
jgi:nucleoside-diphosphate-sugar epimerase